MVTYLSSGKSRHTSKVFPLLENILKNSQDFCKFKALENITLLFSYDNIQTLLKSHRIGGGQHKQRLSVVICSVVCLAPDGLDTKCDIQYVSKTLQQTGYQVISLRRKRIFLSIEIFENILKEALEYVEKDVDENLQDWQSL